VAKYSDSSNDSGVTFKKRKKVAKKGGLSFDNEEEGDGLTPAKLRDDDMIPLAEDGLKKRRSLKPNTSLSSPAPKALTKSALARDAQLKESLRREYLQIQEAVRATEFCLPFVFFDGKDAPGGVCRMKKGDAIWLFLDRARKLGATAAAGSRKDWARIGVDDLMLVKGELIIPHVSTSNMAISHGRSLTITPPSITTSTTSS
jgi:protein FAM50